MVNLQRELLKLKKERRRRVLCLAGDRPDRFQVGETDLRGLQMNRCLVHLRLEGVKVQILKVRLTYIYIRFRFVWSRSVVVRLALQRSTWNVWLLLLHSSWVWVLSMVLWCCRPPACVVCIGYTQTAAIPPHLSSPFFTAKVYLLESLKKNNVIKMCFSSIVHPPASSSCIDHLLNAFRVLSMAQSPSSVGGVAVDVPVWDIYFREEKKKTPSTPISYRLFYYLESLWWLSLTMVSLPRPSE